MGKLASTAVYTCCQIYLNPFSSIKLVKGFTKILLVYRAVFNALLNSSSEVFNYIRITLIVFKILS